MVSSGIRGTITRFKNKLSTCLTDSSAVLAKDDKELDEKDIKTCRKYLDRILHDTEELKRKDEEWEGYRRELGNKGEKDELKVEEELYEQYANGDDGYLVILSRGEDRVVDLKLIIEAFQTEGTVVSDRRSVVFRDAREDGLLGNTARLNRLRDQRSHMSATNSQQQHNDDASIVLRNPEPSSSTRRTGRPATSVKLPKLTLPRFDGDIRSWPEFWDTFRTTVHEADLPDSHKLNYLRGQLDGAAKTAIKGLTVTDDNYCIAVDTLTERFGDLAHVRNVLYADLRKVPAVKGTSVAAVRLVVDEVEMIFKQLQSLGEDVEQAALVTMVLEKLPAAVVDEVDRKRDSFDPWSVGELRNALQNYVRQKERAQRLCKPGSDVSVTDAPVVIPETQTFAVRAESIKGWDAGMKLCAFCEGRHLHKMCSKYRTGQERYNRVRDLRLCKICLRPGHVARNCRSHAQRCRKCGWTGHHEAVCNRGDRKDGVPHEGFRRTGEAHPTPQRQNSRVYTNRTSSDCTTRERRDDREADGDDDCMTNGRTDDTGKVMCKVGAGKTVVLLTVKAKVRVPGDQSVFVIYAILDTASQRTFVSEKLAERLRLPQGKGERLDIDLFAGNSCQMDSKIVQLDLILANDEVLPIRANTSSDVVRKCRPPTVVTEEDRRIVERLPNGAQLCNGSGDVLPEILIGLDYFWQIVYLPGVPLPPNVPAGRMLPSGLFLIPTKLGLTVGGPIDEAVPVCSLPLSVYHTDVHRSYVDIEGETAAGAVSNQTVVDHLWKLESIGITESPTQDDDDVAQAHFDATVFFDKDTRRYVARWPWKTDRKEHLPDNKVLALHRFKRTVQKFKAEPDVLRKYAQIIRDQFAKGVIEVAPEVEPERGQNAARHYLPHHPVVTPQKTTTKVRIVYDASARERSGAFSLNDCLYRGPVILPSLVGLLLRFRCHKIGVVSDVEKAFLQVALHQEDRDVTRFFWLRDDKRPATEGNTIVCRFARVPFGIVSSPFLLASTIRHHLKQDDSWWARKAVRNIYMDNVIVGVDSDAEAVDFYQKGKSSFADASMNLREWTSNSAILQQILPKSDKAEDKVVKVLGIPWDVTCDTVGVPRFKDRADKRTDVTKRGVLHSIASVYDPLGWLVPVTLLGKLLFQDLWRRDYGWDDLVPSNLTATWCAILDSLNAACHVVLKRHLPGVQPGASHSLVAFTDASASAYATVVYLRSDVGGSVRVDLLFSRSRLAPRSGTKTKKGSEISIPRLELLGLLIGTRACSFITKELDLSISDTWVMSDSMAALQWVTTDRQLSVFVDNRAREIRSAKVHLRHVPGEQNPADGASRGVSYPDLQKSLWFHGPDWLKRPPATWPVTVIDKVLCKESQSEIRKTVRCSAVATATTGGSICDVFVVTNYSSLTKLLRVTVLCLKFLRRIDKRRLLSEVYEGLADGFNVRCHDVLEAKRLWDIHEQDAYLRQREGLRGTEKQLGLARDGRGVVRCRGRFTLLDFDDSPKLLPNGSWYTSLVIRDYHARLLHAGVATTLNELRKEYWVPKGRSKVRSVLSRCTLCKRHAAGPFSKPAYAPLPLKRLTRSCPFQYVGLDYFGPLNAKTDGQVTKVWVCIYTCLAVRAVHLEVVHSLSAEDFIDCFRRIISRRGRPDWILSDNAPCFHLTKNAFDVAWAKVLGSDKLRDFVTNKGIQWKFTTEFAPWEGGIYERLISIVKSALRRLMGRSCLKLVKLSTLLTEIEQAANSRPITYVHESNMALSPNSFLIGNRVAGIPDLSDDVADSSFEPLRSTQGQLVEAWRKHDALLNQFWDLWQAEYLSMLRERTKLEDKKVKGSVPRHPVVGEIVLLGNRDLPRRMWNLGRITEIRTSETDMQVRSARVKMASGKVLTRPVSLLYPLEVYSNPVKDKESTIESNDRCHQENLAVDGPVGGKENGRPKRRAAEQARIKISDQLRDEVYVVFSSPGRAHESEQS